MRPAEGGGGEHATVHDMPADAGCRTTGALLIP